MGITNSADPNGICFDRRMDTFDLAVCDETSSKSSENNRNCPKLRKPHYKLLLQHFDDIFIKRKME